MKKFQHRHVNQQCKYSNKVHTEPKRNCSHTTHLGQVTIDDKVRGRKGADGRAYGCLECGSEMSVDADSLPASAKLISTDVCDRRASTQKLIQNFQQQTVW